jgi:hypothetical protein
MGVRTVKGRVTQLFGPRLMIADGSGRMLIDTGRGRNRRLAQPLPVAVNAAIAVAPKTTAFDSAFPM